MCLWMTYWWPDCIQHRFFLSYIFIDMNILEPCPQWMGKEFCQRGATHSLSALQIMCQKSHSDLLSKIIFNDLSTDNCIRSFINFVERIGNLVIRKKKFVIYSLKSCHTPLLWIVPLVFWSFLDPRTMMYQSSSGRMWGGFCVRGGMGVKK